MEPNYIIVEGVIGVGKTSLASMLADRLNGQLILENHEENPFLADFYKDSQRFAFQTELYFLLSRYRQQIENLRQRDLFQKHTVSDYHFVKSRIFASVTLEEREFKLMDHVASLLEREVRKPDLLIYLQADSSRLLYNIKRRGRIYEREINPKYIESLVEAYNSYYFHYDDSPLLIVNATKVDFVNKGDDFEDLFNHILNSREGSNYYNPASGVIT